MSDQPRRDPVEAARQAVRDSLDDRHLSDLYERYDGSKGFAEWAEEQRADARETYALVSSFTALPAELEEPLGPARSAELVAQVQDRLPELKGRERDDLSADATQVGALALKLDRPFCEEVVRLEGDRQKIRGELTETHRFLSRLWDDLGKVGVDADGTEVNLTEEEWKLDAIASTLDAVDEMLEEAKADPRHPDRWVKESGPAAVNALAAKHTIMFENERARQAHEAAVGQEAPAPEPQRAVTESGYGF